jgi:hypothetical protein
MKDTSTDAIEQLARWANEGQSVFVAVQYMSERIETVTYRGHLAKESETAYVLKPAMDGAVYGVHFDLRFGKASFQPTPAGPSVQIQAAKYAQQGDTGHGLRITAFSPY